MKKKSSFVLILLLFSCNNIKEKANNVPNFDMIGAKNISFDELVIGVECFNLIAPETDFCFKIIEYDAFFYLYSFGGVSVFRKSGEYVRTITSRSIPNDILVNEREKQLWILDNLDVIKKYSLDGQYIEQQKLSFKAAKIAPAGINHFLFFEGALDKSSPSFLRIVSGDDFSTIKRFVPKYNINNTIPISTFAYNSDRTHIYLPYNDTIYDFDNTNLNIIPRWHLDFSGDFLTHNDIPEGGFSDRQYADLMKENTKYMGIQGVHNVNKFIFMQLNGKDNSFRVIDITNNIIYRYNTLIDNIKVSPQGSTTDGLLVVMTTKDFILHYSNPKNGTQYESIKELINKVSELDKGLIVLKIKIKEDLP